jgi:hypothetical protein
MRQSISDKILRVSHKLRIKASIEHDVARIMKAGLLGDSDLEPFLESIRAAQAEVDRSSRLLERQGSCTSS